MVASRNYDICKVLLNFVTHNKKVQGCSKEKKIDQLR